MARHASALPLFGLVAMLAVAPASATDVSFSGVVVNLCVLTLATPGTLGLAADGTSLSSDSVGGLNATLSVAASGSTPTLSFAAPQLTGPSGSTGGATTAIAYTSAGGANHGFTSGPSSYAMNRLIDVVTVRGRALNTAGFASGTYGIAATVTRQQ